LDCQPANTAQRLSGDRMMIHRKKGSTAWCAFPNDTKYFNPSEKPFMINYRVDNLVALLDELKKENVTIVDEIAEYDYGKFVHVLDPEGNIIELWEPKDE
jgi:predicted enzyme related to lactoylglutathione lyase